MKAISPTAAGMLPWISQKPSRTTAQAAQTLGTAKSLDDLCEVFTGIGSALVAHVEGPGNRRLADELTGRDPVCPGLLLDDLPPPQAEPDLRFSHPHHLGHSSQFAGEPEGDGFVPGGPGNANR